MPRIENAASAKRGLRLGAEGPISKDYVTKGIAPSLTDNGWPPPPN